MVKINESSLFSVWPNTLSPLPQCCPVLQSLPYNTRLTKLTWWKVFPSIGIQHSALTHLCHLCHHIPKTTTATYMVNKWIITPSRPWQHKKKITFLLCSMKGIFSVEWNKSVEMLIGKLFLDQSMNVQKPLRVPEKQLAL